MSPHRGFFNSTGAEGVFSEGQLSILNWPKAGHWTFLPDRGFYLPTARRYSHDHSITSEVLSLVCPSLRGLKIQIHFCGTYVLSVWFTLLIWFGSVWIFSRINNQLILYCTGVFIYYIKLFKMIRILCTVLCTIDWLWNLKMKIQNCFPSKIVFLYRYHWNKVKIIHLILNV